MTQPLGPDDLIVRGRDLGPARGAQAPLHRLLRRLAARGPVWVALDVGVDHIVDGQARIRIGRRLWLLAIRITMLPDRCRFLP